MSVQQEERGAFWERRLPWWQWWQYLVGAIGLVAFWLFMSGLMLQSWLFDPRKRREMGVLGGILALVGSGITFAILWFALSAVGAVESW